jgi:hypothetical protein
MKVERIWAMPNQWTFQIAPIKTLLGRYVGDGKDWIDPFAGLNSPAEFTNDLNPQAPTKSHLEAKEFVKQFQGKRVKGAIIDPPYSLRQIKECYDSIGLKLPYEITIHTFDDVKDLIAPLIAPGGYVICCGWNTNGFGKNRGFDLVEILLVPHGGFHNDTIVTVERRMNCSLDDLASKVELP